MFRTTWVPTNVPAQSGVTTIEKLIYVLWGPDTPQLRAGLAQSLTQQTAGRLIQLGAKALSINIHDDASAQAPSPVPTPEGEDPHMAQVSMWVDCYEGRTLIEEALGDLQMDFAGYLVVESLYDDYGTTPHAGPRDWPDGQRSPGVLTVALIHRPEGLDYAEWIRRWHGTQSVVSAQLQPRTRYVRNEVVRSLTSGAPEIHAIVEEGWPSPRHISDPMLFFNAGSQEELEANIETMLDSVNGCLDLARLRSATMSEYLMKSFS